MFTGCLHKGKDSTVANQRTEKDSNSNALCITYAKNFTIEELDEGTYITVKNPWIRNDTLATYFLIGENSNAGNTRISDFVIRVPVKQVVTLSSTYIGMFCLLKEENCIKASSNARLLYDSILYQRYCDGTLADLGETVNLNVEAVIDQAPDLVMKYIYMETEDADRKIIQAGIPVAYNLEFMETHPLGRAEWIKFVAAFVDKKNMADSIFHTIEKNYLYISELTRNEAVKPTVLDGSSYKGIWYAAGGKSYPAQLYRDAGADYFWKSDTSYGSIPVSFEVIMENLVDADYWIGPSTGSRMELLQIEPRYALLKSFRKGNVFFFGKRINANGGYDYYESGVLRPDILLKDLVWVFHPDLLDPAYETVYLEKMK
jgi:iron complex transport system substrate-binding protein